MFEDAKVGNKVWDFIDGWGKVIAIEKLNEYPLNVEFINGHYRSYDFHGKAITDERQRLFWDEIKFEVPEKPFILKDFLKDNLKPKEFEYNCKNGVIYYSHIDKKIRGDFSHCTEAAFLYFQPGNIGYVERILNDKKITMKQLKQAYKELGWL